MIAVFAYIKGAQPFSLSHIQMIYLLILGGVIVHLALSVYLKVNCLYSSSSNKLILLMEILLGPLYAFLRDWRNNHL